MRPASPLIRRQPARRRPWSAPAPLRAGFAAACLLATVALPLARAEAQPLPGTRIVTQPVAPGGGLPTRGPSLGRPPMGGMLGGIVGGIVGGAIGGALVPARPSRAEPVEEIVVEEPVRPRRPAATGEPVRPRRPVVVVEEPGRPKRPVVVEEPGRPKRPVVATEVPPRPKRPPVADAETAQPKPAREKAAKPSQQAARKPPPTRPATPPTSPAGPVVAAAGEPTIVPDEVLFEVRAGVEPRAVEQLARSLRLTRISSARIDLIDSTIYRYRIPDRRAVGAVVETLRRDPRVAAAQPNSIFRLQEEPARPAPRLAGEDKSGGMLASAQYALAKMRLAEAHKIATGEAVTVAVIDSAIDVEHPELAGSVTGRFDPVGGPLKPHGHGTGVAGILAAHAQLTGAAPRVKLLAIRAFGGERGKPGADGTTLHILQSLDWSQRQGAQVVNMSFAGPKDDLLSRTLAAARRKGAVLVAAAGNAGPKAPPLYPAADESVIAVGATDAEDRVFAASNQGAHLCVAAPGVDILAPAPAGSYQMMSGTSMAAPHVSGVVALLLQAKPGLAPEAVRAALVAGAKDLGAPGPDATFGAGLTDALAILEAATGPSARRDAPAALATADAK